MSLHHPMRRGYLHNLVLLLLHIVILSTAKDPMLPVILSKAKNLILPVILSAAKDPIFSVILSEVKDPIETFDDIYIDNSTTIDF